MVWESLLCVCGFVARFVRRIEMRGVPGEGSAVWVIQGSSRG